MGFGGKGNGLLIFLKNPRNHENLSHHVDKDKLFNILVLTYFFYLQPHKTKLNDRLYLRIYRNSHAHPYW